MMQLVYTDIGQDMTTILAEQADRYAKEGKRVFYIAPNSLSFEKERKVLENLSQRASFAITITRFAQMARYFTLKVKKDKVALNDKGLAMVCYRVLAGLNKGELGYYEQMKRDMAFIRQLVNLYQEMAKGQLVLSDLQVLDAQKYSDLALIFSGMDQFLQEHQLDIISPLETFSQAIETDFINEQLSNVVVIIDGFTRFSADEERLVGLLNNRCHEVVIGSYASQKAYRAQYRQGNVYEASVDFLNHLAQLFQTRPFYLKGDRAKRWFDSLSECVEASFGFGEEVTALPVADAPIQIWETSTQKAELEEVAKQIRVKLFEGYRYKDILLLLGDTDSYRLHLPQIFHRYGIPYYLGKAESMAHHPLVHFIETLDRLMRNHFKSEDFINLLKTGLYGSLSMAETDQFEQYMRFLDIKGLAAFQRPFKHNKDNRFDLNHLNALRASVMTPLVSFFSQKSQSVSQLMERWYAFLGEIRLTENMARLVERDRDLNRERHEEVWRTFSHVLESMAVIFKDEKLGVAEFIALLRSGLEGAEYRVVPARRDVVTVKSYDLIEPHTAKLVYAVGLTQEHFPKLSQNTSLLTDEERQLINEKGSKGRLEIASQDNQKKNHFVWISLLNAASDQLILSSPRKASDSDVTSSPYLKQLKRLGLGVEEKTHQTMAIDDLGSYYGLLSRLLDFYQADGQEEDIDKEQQTFWSVGLRVLRQQLAREGLVLPEMTDGLSVSRVSQEVMERRYPKNQGLVLSASALTDFYDNEYTYFLRHVLGLQEELSIHPDARQDGQFLHKVFERVVADKSEQPFDVKLETAIYQTKAEPDNVTIYQYDVQGQYTQGILEDIAKATARQLLKNPEVVETVAEEAVFGQDKSYSFTLDNGYDVMIHGKMDRLDRLVSDESYGVVDYKSSAKTFHLSHFYNKLSPQLLTYLAALTVDQQIGGKDVFGAMYLHMQEPLIQLMQTTSVDDVLAQAHKELRYKGLFLEDKTNRLNHLYDSARSQYSHADLSLMLDYTHKLYKEAAERILSGYFAINPYTKDGQTILGQQFKAITGFEANRHMSEARLLTAFPRKEQKQRILDRIKGDLAL